MIKKYAIYYSFLYLIIICAIFRCGMPKNNIRDKKRNMQNNCIICVICVAFVQLCSGNST